MKKAVVVCDGEFPHPARYQRYAHWADTRVACDGGLAFFLEQKSRPDYVIGDLDSLSQELRTSGDVLILHDPDQESNDLEKALHQLLEEGHTEVVVLGATGKRLDHTLKNVSVLAQFTPLFERIYFEDQYGIIYVNGRISRIKVPEGTVISLFPLSGKVDGIRTRGLKYPLNDESLENGVRDGSSNEAIAEEVVIETENGHLIVMLHAFDVRPVHE